MLVSLCIATVSFLTIFIEGAQEKIVAAGGALSIFPLGWLLLKLEDTGAQIPLDAVEEFGSPGGYEIIIPAPPWARQRSYQVVEEKFGSDTITPAVLEEICTRSPNSLIVLTYGGAVVGYTDVYTLEPAALDKFVTGQISERELTAEMIVAHPARGTVTDLYLAGIVVTDCQT